MYEVFSARGYANADPEFNPHVSERHGFYKLEKEGRFYFAKYSKSNGTRASSIATDIWWCQTVQQLRSERQLTIRTPQIIDYGDDWYVAEWIEGHPSVGPIDPASCLDRYISANG